MSFQVNNPLKNQDMDELHHVAEIDFLPNNLVNTADEDERLFNLAKKRSQDSCLKFREISLSDL